MKLVRVDHIRCDERQATDYAWCPDEWSEEIIEIKVRAAQDAYLKAMTDWREANPEPHVVHRPDFSKVDPSKTVGEVFAEHEKKREAWKAWETKREEARRPYAAFLARQGFTWLWDNQEEIVEVDWGHRHGQRINYGTELQGFPSPSELVTGEDPNDF